MNKTYIRINWQNAPSEATALNDVNLNKMDSAIDTIDDRVVTHDTQLTNDESAISTLQGSVISNISDIASLQGSVASQASDITALQSGKVDKEAGKGLSSISGLGVTASVNTGDTIADIIAVDQSGNTYHNPIKNGIEVDSSLSTTSENPVQNKAVTNSLNTKVDKISGKGLFNFSNMQFYDDTMDGEVIAHIIMHSQNPDPLEPDMEFDFYNGMVAISNAEIDALE